jgi:hypothetical protein
VNTVSRSVVMPFAETHDFVARKHLAPTQRNRSAVSRCLSEYSLSDPTFSGHDVPGTSDLLVTAGLQNVRSDCEFVKICQIRERGNAAMSDRAS